MPHWVKGTCRANENVFAINEYDKEASLGQFGCLLSVLSDTRLARDSNQCIAAPARWHEDLLYLLRASQKRRDCQRE